MCSSLSDYYLNRFDCQVWVIWTCLIVKFGSSEPVWLSSCVIWTGLIVKFESVDTMEPYRFRIFVRSCICPFIGSLKKLTCIGLDCGLQNWLSSFLSMNENDLITEKLFIIYFIRSVRTQTKKVHEVQLVANEGYFPEPGG